MDQISAPRVNSSSALDSLVSTLAKIALLFLLSSTVADAQKPSNDPALDTITVEAQRKQAELRRQVAEFVDTALQRHDDTWSNAKWIIPICPLVAGLSKDQGEFVLTRISSIASTAGARLDSSKCSANLLVIVTNEPDRLLAQWHRSNPSAFDDTEGLGKLKRFMSSSRPVRVWYNSQFLSSFFNVPLIYTGAGGVTYPENRHALASRLKYDSIRAITSVIVIVDRKQLADLNFGQLSDYVALLALAEINLDKDHGNAPTILNLFTYKDRAPREGLSSWDEAFLKALYGTRQQDRLQLSEMTNTMTKSLEGQ